MRALAATAREGRGRPCTRAAAEPPSPRVRRLALPVGRRGWLRATCRLLLPRSGGVSWVGRALQLWRVNAGKGLQLGCNVLLRKARNIPQGLYLVAHFCPGAPPSLHEP